MAWVCGQSLAGIAGSNFKGGSLLNFVVFFQVDVSTLVLSLVQRSPTGCGVSECDRETSIMRMPWLTGGLLSHGKE